MPKTVDDFNKRRLRSSNITVVISISLVLFLVGLIGLILVNARDYSDYVKEQLVVEAYFDEHLDPRDSAKILKLQEETFNQIKQQDYVKKAKYISKEEASVIAKKQMGIDSEALFEKDIFPASVEITLKPQFVDPVKLNDIISKLRAIKGVKDVVNDSKLTIDVYNNLNRIMTWILAFSILFLVVAIILINNSIRLKIFSKRFTIKTMQLVGAKRRFILMPFIKEAAILGLVGALIAILALGAVWYYFTSMIQQEFDPNQYIMLIFIILFIGIFITISSTIFATWRFLKSNVDDLYYS